MTNDNNIPVMTDADLDMYLNEFAVPGFDENAFDKRLMTAIQNDSDMKAPQSTGFIWFRPAAAMMAAVAAIFASILYFQADSGLSPSQNTAQVMAGLEQAAPAASERTVVATNAWDDEMFVAEMADQDILLIDYMADDYNQPDPPPIDDFLDELLGVESRQL